MQIHRYFFQYLDRDNICPGKVRDGYVMVGDYIAPSPGQVVPGINNLGCFLRGNKVTLDKHEQAAYNLIKVAIAHAHFETIHPFRDLVTVGLVGY